MTEVVVVVDQLTVKESKYNYTQHCLVVHWWFVASEDFAIFPESHN